MLISTNVSLYFPSNEHFRISAYEALRQQGAASPLRKAAPCVLVLHAITREDLHETWCIASKRQHNSSRAFQPIYQILA